MPGQFYEYLKGLAAYDFYPSSGEAEVGISL